MEFLNSVPWAASVTSPPLAQGSLGHRGTFVLCSTEVRPVLSLPGTLLECPHGPIFYFTAIPDSALGRETFHALEVEIPKVI